MDWSHLPQPLRGYYELLEQSREAQARGDFATQLVCYRSTVPLLSGLVDATRKKYGGFDLTEIPAIDPGASLMASLGDIQSLQALRKIVSQQRGLRPWLEGVDRAVADAELMEQILAVVREQPGILQRDLGQRMANQKSSVPSKCERLQRFGRLRRERSGASYVLYPATPQSPPPASPPTPAPAPPAPAPAPTTVSRRPSARRSASGAGCGAVLLISLMLALLLWGLAVSGS